MFKKVKRIFFVKMEMTTEIPLAIKLFNREKKLIYFDLRLDNRSRISYLRFLRFLEAGGLYLNIQHGSRSRL